jgi:hypothetical protein
MYEVDSCLVSVQLHHPIMCGPDLLRPGSVQTDPIRLIGDPRSCKVDNEMVSCNAIY